MNIQKNFSHIFFIKTQKISVHNFVHVNSRIQGGAKVFERLFMKTEVFTVRQIANRLNQSQSKIDSIIRRNQLKPILRVGGTRLFDELSFEKINLEFLTKQEIAE